MWSYFDGLPKAINGFSEGRRLRTGNFGMVYEERFFNDKLVAIKKIKHSENNSIEQARDRVVLLLVFLAKVFAFVPFRFIVMLVILEAFTREMPYKKENSDKLMRRAR
ncbi:Protein kinase-like domain containing protein [Parasponia andersonii]|uniref:Protein kinase-like domain containing protein n=1 Tax=Parasponia andersonii TaxID=3476 RepID=A0A2P5D330_PARAD|nr:Protein kinase-like domain containing protein [Parasponia andersonii]